MSAMEQSLDEDEMGMGRGTSGAAAEAMMMDTTPMERRHPGGYASSVVRSLRRLCVEAVADHFGRHSRELLNLSPAARELLLAHLKARFNPARRHRYLLRVCGGACACACACAVVHVRVRVRWSVCRVRWCVCRVRGS